MKSCKPIAALLIALIASQLATSAGGLASDELTGKVKLQCSSNCSKVTTMLKSAGCRISDNFESRCSTAVEPVIWRKVYGAQPSGAECRNYAEVVSSEMTGCMSPRDREEFIRGIMSSCLKQ
jgi:hypothetical protein